jgi:hypothetical protein
MEDQTLLKSAGFPSSFCSPALSRANYAATNRYNAPLPENALVLHNDYELREFTATHPDLNLDTANGG